MHYPFWKDSINFSIFVLFNLFVSLTHSSKFKFEFFRLPIRLSSFICNLSVAAILSDRSLNRFPIVWWALKLSCRHPSFGCRAAPTWSVWMDSNHRPRAYQARALATWATDRFFLIWLIQFSPLTRLLPCWWRWRESNPWPPACRAGALPAELHPHILYMRYYWVDLWSLKIEQQVRSTC